MVEDGEGDAVFGRAAGLEVFKFGVDRAARVGCEGGQEDKRGGADGG